MGVLSIGEQSLRSNNELFAEFVKASKEPGEGYLDGKPTDVIPAYWAFLNCVEDEFTRADVVEESNA